MKIKIITIVIFLVSIFFLLTTTVCAIDTSIEDSFPDDAKQMLIENGFSSLDYESLLNLTPQQVFSYILNLIKNELDTPFVFLYLIFLVIIIISIITGINGGFLSKELDNSITTVGVLTICTTSLVPIVSCMEETRKFISNLCGFNNVFTPILSGAMAFSGQIKTGAGYQTIMLFANEFISVFISSVILPLVYFYFAFTVIGRTAVNFNIDSISNAIKSSVNICLTFSMTIFVSLITLKGIISVGGDSVALRTGKIFIGNFVPAVGGALSEAAGTIYKSIGLIKNTTGAFGIIVAVMYLLPSILKVLIFKFTCMISSIFGEMLGAGKIAGLLKDISGILNIMISIILSVSSIFILSTAITLIISGSV